MFGQRLSNPAIFALICAQDDNEVVAGGIVCVKEIGDDLEKAQATSEDDEFIFVPKFVE